MTKVRALTTRKLDMPLVALAVLATLSVGLRYFIIGNVVGSNDIHYWTNYGDKVLNIGLLETYRTVQAFNHPPLMGYWGAGCMWVNNNLHIWYPVCFKTLGVLGDVLCAYLLASETLVAARRRSVDEIRARRMSLGIAVIFLFNPISLLITTFHGNTDSMVGAMCLLAAVLARRNKPLLSGLALAGAINVKLVPIFLIPPLLLIQPNGRATVRFLIGGAIGMLPFVPIAVLVGREFYEHAIVYNSNADRWGLQEFFAELVTAPTIGSGFAAARAVYASSGRYIMLFINILIGLWCWRGRRGDAVKVAALGIAVFLILSPGFGVQYLVWPVALVFALDVTSGVLFSISAALFGMAIYLQHWNGQWSGAQAYLLRPFDPWIGLVGLFAWVILCRFAALQLRSLGPFRLVPRASVAVASPESAGGGTIAGVVED